MWRSDSTKKEKWTYKHWKQLNIHCHCGTIEAVFDFYAGTVRRAPLWWHHTRRNALVAMNEEELKAMLLNGEQTALQHIGNSASPSLIQSIEEFIDKV